MRAFEAIYIQDCPRSSGVSETWGVFHRLLLAELAPESKSESGLHR